MKRRPSFRKDNDLQSEIRRINKLVQNKQSRLRVNKGLEVQDVETRKIKEFASRREAETYLRGMNKFLTKKADFRVTNEKGANLQYSEVMEVENTIRRINKQKNKVWDSIKNLPYTHKGVPTGLTVEEQANPVIGMGDPKFGDLKPLTFNPGRYRTEKEFRDRLKRLDELYGGDWVTEVQESYRDNYIEALKNNLGDDSKHLQKIVKDMPLDDFIKMYYTENNAHIDFVYDKLGIKARVKELDRVFEPWVKEEGK